MKKCLYCGGEFPEDVLVCPQDAELLVGSAPDSNADLVPKPLVQLEPAARTSTVLGILAFIPFFTTPLFAILAIAFGHVALSRLERSPKRLKGKGVALAGLTLGYFCLAMSIVVAWSAVSAAQAMANEIACCNNLKTLGLSARQWSAYNSGTFPKDIMQLTNEPLMNPTVFLCPVDPLHKRPRLGNPTIWNTTNISYLFLAPGMKEDKATNQAVFRCPFHGIEILGDGTVKGMKSD